MKTEVNIEAIELLQTLIGIPSFSGEEEKTAGIIQNWFVENDMSAQRKFNNVYAFNKYFDPDKPTCLLNSHHDTVKPNSQYTNDPFNGTISNGKLYGLGSNDAGGCVVSMLQVFKHFYHRTDLSYNLIIAISGEEENSGKHGISCLIPELPVIEFAIVGEPTEMKMAVAEKGLLVLDVQVSGKSGHAAHGHTRSAIFEALPDLNWFEKYEFPMTSDLLGGVKMTVTQINSGTQHNVVPGHCHFVVDVRTNECYSNEQVLEIVNSNVKSEVKPRSTHLQSSSIDLSHPVVKCATTLGIKTYGSPTLSDQCRLAMPSVKIGPGNSLRSHAPNEFIHLDEIVKGIETYQQILESVLKPAL